MLPFSEFITDYALKLKTFIDKLVNKPPNSKCILKTRPRPHVYVFMRKRILFCSFSPSVHTQTLIQRFRKSPFLSKTETFENGVESGDFRKRRLSKTHTWP